MSTSDLRSLIKLASTGVEASFAKNGRLSPFWHCVDAAGTPHFVASPAIEDKDFSVAAMRAFMELNDIVRYCFVDEAWTALLMDDAEAREFISSGLSVASHPLRKEVVMFSAEDESGMLTAQREILRPHGKPPRLGPLEINDLTGWTSKGRFVGMLPRRGTVQ